MENIHGSKWQVIVEVAPEELRNNMLTGTLKGALFAISSHHCGNYVVQALVASAKTSDQVYVIQMFIGNFINFFHLKKMSLQQVDRPDQNKCFLLSIHIASSQ
jgi:6-pyruvoyl-tetrahydropterin synthase